MLTRTASRISRFILLVVASLLLVTFTGAVGQVAAVPGSVDAVALRAQNVDWMTTDEATSLDMSFPVLIPTWIPAPFSGSPAISGGGEYYSLYWVNYGGAPTFLQVTGEVGGSLPAGSPADLNVELAVNASVQGYEAIHDVTGIYDNVWWVAGGVLYTVSSNNMTGTDSLSLANSLIPLEPPVVEEPDPPTPPPAEEPDVTGSESEAETGTGSVPEQSIEIDNGGDEPVETPTAVPDEPTDGVGGNAESTVVPGPTGTASTSNSIANSLSRSAPVALSDGTAGPALPSGGDGTGGIRQVAIP